MATLADNARRRLKDALERQHTTQRELGQLLNCSQSCAGKILTGRTQLSVNDLEILCRAAGISPVEAVRDPGLQFVADLTPLELRILENYRLASEGLKAAIAEILDVKVRLPHPERYAKARPAKAKPASVKKLHKT